jgi:class 3 adenylate cyclase
MKDATIQDLLHQAMQAELAGRFDEAIARLQQAAAGTNPSLVLDTRLRLGKLFIQRRRLDEAATVLSAARTQAEKEGSPGKAASAGNLLAFLERRRNPALALRLLEDNSPLKMHGAPRAQAAQWFHYRGLLEADCNNLAEAERLLFRAHDLYREIPDTAGLAEVYDSLANLLLLYGRIRPALEFARRSLDLKIVNKDRFGQAISHGTIGRACMLQANYAAAETAFHQDLKLAREMQDPAGIGIMLNSLGEVALLRRDLTEAARRYEESLAHEGGVAHTVHAYLGLARVHLAAGRLDEAAAAADQMHARLPGRTDLPGLPHALLGLRGAVAGRRGDFAEGERRLREAIEALRRDRFDLDTLPFLYELRDLYQRQGQTAKAVRVMSQALDLLSECGAEESISGVEEWLRQVDSPALTRLALERHFPAHLVPDILAGKLAPEMLTAEQEITVLFSDLRNYTTLSEGLAPAAILEILNEWFGEATRAIRQHGGIVDKFIGDAVMALFGVPQPRDDAAADAVRAALAMRDALSARNLRHKALGGREIQIGIGVHTGRAVVGFIGSHLRLSYTAIGDTVNTASRLESVTKAYPGCDILISQATEDGQQRCRVAETEYKGFAELKGHTPLAVYQVGSRRGGQPSP